MKLIIIRAFISIASLLLSYLASLAVASFKLPVLLVFSFIISQCVNECLSSSIKEKEKENNDAELKKKEDEIQSLKERMQSHYNKLDDIYDSAKIPTKEKKQLKILKVEILDSITYKHKEEITKPKEEPLIEHDNTLNEAGAVKEKTLAPT